MKKTSSTSSWIKTSRIWLSILGLALMVSSCALPTSPAQNLTSTPSLGTPSSVATAAPKATDTAPVVYTATKASGVTETPVPTDTNVPPGSTQAPTATTAPASATSTPPAATATPVSSDNLPAYLDDRSTATEVIQSLFNAINRREYLRAFSYWDNPGSNDSPPSYDQFKQGYQNTVSVQVTVGTVTGDAGAGQYNFSVPVVLASSTTDGKTQTYAGCYIVHLGNPANFGAPPIHPMGISRGVLKLAGDGADVKDILVNGCKELGLPTGSDNPPYSNGNPNDVTASNYLDNRSGPVQVLRSLFNSINRKEYVRAYSYWQNPQSGNVQPYDKFQAGYQATDTVEVAFGEISSDIGAGQIRYLVPTALRVKTTAGDTQTFVGCYQLHLSQPAIQDAPPFAPLGIEKAQVKQASNDADLSTLPDGACQNMP